MFTRDFGVNVVLRGQSLGQMSSSMSFSVKEYSTKGHVHNVLDIENKFFTTKPSQHEYVTVLCTLVHPCSLDGYTSTVRQAPLGRITC